MGFIYRKILFRDKFSIWVFAQVHFFQYHIQDQKNSGNVLWGVALGGRMKNKVNYYDIIVGGLKKSKMTWYYYLKGE